MFLLTTIPRSRKSANRRRRLHPRNARRAFTLIELMVGMTSGVGILLLAIGTVNQTLTLSSMGKQRSERRQLFSRLGQQFRADAYAARAATLIDSDQQQILHLELADGSQVTYTNSSVGFKRERTSPTMPTKEQESVQVGEKYALRLAKSETPVRLELRLERQTPEETLIENRVIASLDRAARLERLSPANPAVTAAGTAAGTATVNTEKGASE